MVENDKQPITGISEDTLMKILDPDQSFKRTNWIEWLANEKSKRNHERWIIGFGAFIICFLTGAFLYAGSIKLLNTETMTTLLGGVVGSGLTIFVRLKNKD